MKADTVQSAVVLGLFCAVLMSGLFWMRREAAVYGEAEEVVYVLRGISRDEIERSADGIEMDLTQSEFLELLKTPPWREYGLHELYVDVPLKEDEFMWFRVNDEYHVCLHMDGGIGWLTQGRRPGE